MAHFDRLPNEKPLPMGCYQCVKTNMNWDWLNALWWPYLGWWLYGSAVPNEQQQSQAIQFTLDKSASVSKLEAGISWVNGYNGVTIGLYADSGGVPGTALASSDVTGLPALGSCCSYVTAKLKKKVALTAGTPYWFVITTDANSATTQAVANYSVTDFVNVYNQASNNGSGWTSYQASPAMNFAVLK